MADHSVEQHVVFSWPKNFLGQSPSNNRAETFEVFRNTFDIPYCPLLLLNCSETRLQDPFVYCLAALATSKLTGVEMFGKGFTGKFSPETIENPNFFGGQVSVCHIPLAQ